MTTGLILAICLAIFLQPNRARAACAVAFAGFTLLHELFGGQYTGYAYYCSAALCDLFIMLTISLVSPVTKMAITLQKICLVSITTNAIGWVIWFVYWPPLAYDCAYIAIYSWALFALVRRDNRHDNVGVNTGSSMWGGFRMPHRARSVTINKLGGTI